MENIKDQDWVLIIQLTPNLGIIFTNSGTDGHKIVVGAIAQLGEHLTGSQKVLGKNIS